MKIRNESAHPPLTGGLEYHLRKFRVMRAFNAEKYIERKVALLQKYVTEYDLTSCVVAVSGGVDSAIVAALVAKVSGLELIPALLPAFENIGVTGQDTATSRGKELCESLGVKPVIIDVAESARVVGNSVLNGLNNGDTDYKTSDWGVGQLVPYVRTPTLYYITTILTDNGKKSFIAGTTNYSEGSYLGYIGKASDAMVDVQLISDIHKYEVYAVAEVLGIPSSIIDIEPTGDMFDGTSDEDVFGASYDFVEVYLNYLALSPLEQKIFKNSLDEESLAYFISFAAKLDAMHAYNKHKYLAGSPAVHLDINSPATYKKFWKKTVWEG